LTQQELLNLGKKIKLMNIRFLYLFVLQILFILTQGYTQNVKIVNSIPSPNATSLGLFGEIPVSQFTGTPQINFPLYEVNSGVVNVPISLSYHASGVRPDVHPGWVGMNMNLMAGGAITRIVKGIPDETVWEQHAQFLDSYNSKFQIGGVIGYLYNTDKLRGTDWSTTTKLESLAKDQNWKDTEPDEFTFTLPNGLTGKFYIKEDGKFVVPADPSIKVEIEDTIVRVSYPQYLVSPAISNISGVFTPTEYQVKGFKITTSDGIQYEFGLWNLKPPTLENGTIKYFENFSIEASANFFGETYFGERYNTWYLKRIIDANNQNEIKFFYEPGVIPLSNESFRFASIVSFTKNIMFDKKQGTSEAKGIFKLFGPVSASSTQLTRYYSGDIIYPIYLRRIESKDLYIDFSVSLTNELEYDYASEILPDLALQAFTTFKPNLHSYTPRISIIIDSNEPNPKKYYIARTDINLATASSTVLSYYAYLSGNTWYVDLPGFFVQGNTMYEGLDFSKLRWHKLDKIEIKSKLNSRTLKAYNFTYSNNSNDRLMLLSFRESDKDGNLLPPYLFEYENYNSDFYPGTGKLPPYNSGKIDHWGFYNGIDSESGLDFNNITSLGSGYFAKRNPVAEHLYTGILNKVTYPTGGFTQFIYEPNQYNRTVIRNKDTGAFSIKNEGTPKLAGGLRIKEIKSSAGYGSPEISRKYEYYDGILGGESQYYWAGYKGKLLSGGVYTSDRFITSTLLPVSSNSAGSHIGYSRIIEKLDGSGWTEYLYSNHNSNIDENYISTIDTQKSIYSPFSDKGFERGQLLETKVFNVNGNLISREKNIYVANPSLAGQFARSVATQQIEVLGGWTIEGTAYKVYTYPYNLSRKEIYTYDTDGTLFNLKSKDVSYNNMNFVAEEKTAQSNNLELINRYKYVSDYLTEDYFLEKCEETFSTCLSNCGDRGNPDFVACRNNCSNRNRDCVDAVSNPTNSSVKSIWKMRKSNRLNAIIEQQTLHKKSGVEITVAGSLNLYKEFGSPIHVSKQIQLDVASPFTTIPFSSITSPNQFTYNNKYSTNAQNYGLYDVYGNLIQYSNENDATVSNLFGYGGKYLIAEIINARVDEVIHTSFESDTESITQDAYTGSKSKLGTYSVTLPYSPGTYILSYWKKEQGGVWTFFEEEHIKTNTNPYLISIGTSSTKIDEVRICPKGSYMTTYTYSPGIGVTSKTDSNNQTVFYQYDSFGRLISIKDEFGNIISSYEYNFKK